MVTPRLYCSALLRAFAHAEGADILIVSAGRSRDCLNGLVEDVHQAEGTDVLL